MGPDVTLSNSNTLLKLNIHISDSDLVYNNIHITYKGFKSPSTVFSHSCCLMMNVGNVEKLRYMHREKTQAKSNNWLPVEIGQNCLVKDVKKAGVGLMQKC